ncbi:MAG: hypothetical protein JXB05_25260 [Myxococcaceae bacterium]|nr:hypothetical protein [Myxococcaceae bacterium]
MAVATLTLVVLTVTGQVVALRSDKPSVAAEDSARIEIRALDGEGRPLRDAQVSLTVNVGSVTEPTPLEDGTFSATYRPPAQEGPQVALFHATLKQGGASAGAWLSLPVHGPHKLRVQAPPRARVQVSIGAASFGPVTATARGEALVPVLIPPGASSAQVTTVDRAGRTRTQTVPLPEPRFARVRLVAPEPPIEASPVRIQGFVVDESGNPAVALPPLSVSVTRGTLGPIEAKEDGLFEISYTAPAPGEGPVSLSAAPLGDTDSASTLQLEPRPAPLAQPTAPQAGASPLAARVGAPAERRPWQPSAGLLMFAQSNMASSTGGGVRLEGALRLARLPVEALVQLELRRNLKVTERFTPAEGVPVTQTFSLSGFGMRVGARWSRPFLSRGVLFADASAGLLRMSGSLRLEDNTSQFSQSLKSLGPAFALGGGLGWAMGPGRLCGQLQWSHAPGQERVRGNLGGLSVGAGYQLVFAEDRGP